MITATIFWWPILAPLEDRRLPPLATIPYLFAAAAASSVLGIILTFAAPGLYPAYIHPVDELGALGLIPPGLGTHPGGRPATGWSADVGAGKSDLSLRHCAGACTLVPPARRRYSRRTGIYLNDGGSCGVKRET